MTDFWYRLSVPTIGEAEIDAATEVLRSGNTTMGEKVEEFEEAFARYVGATHAVMVNSGSSADLLMAMLPGHRGEVLIPAVTWPTHVWAYKLAGYDVKLIDVDGLNTTEEIVDEAWTDATIGLSLVHLMGIPAQIGPGRVETEDCCEALGASVGRLGKAASWSFFFSHQMTTMEGGMVTTHDRTNAHLVRSMRSHGWLRHLPLYADQPYIFRYMGFNLRPTEVAAAIGLVQLDRLPTMNAVRADNRRLFVEALEGCPDIEMPTVPEGVTPSFFGLPFFVGRGRRDDLAEYLHANGVETRPILGGNLLRHAAFDSFPKAHLPGANRVHDEGLFVGLHPIADDGVKQVAQLIGEWA